MNILTDAQLEVLSLAPEAWAKLPPSIGCTNATLDAIERRGLVEARFDPQSQSWQWRKTPGRLA